MVGAAVKNPAPADLTPSVAELIQTHVISTGTTVDHRQDASGAAGIQLGTLSEQLDASVAKANGLKLYTGRVQLTEDAAEKMTSFIAGKKEVGESLSAVAESVRGLVTTIKSFDPSGLDSSDKAVAKLEELKEIDRRVIREKEIIERSLEKTNEVVKAGREIGIPQKNMNAYGADVFEALKKGSDILEGVATWRDQTRLDLDTIKERLLSIESTKKGLTFTDFGNGRFGVVASSYPLFEELKAATPAAAEPAKDATVNPTGLIARFKEVAEASKNVAKETISPTHDAISIQITALEAKIAKLGETGGKSFFQKLRSGEYLAAIPLVGGRVLANRVEAATHELEKLQSEQQDNKPGGASYVAALRSEIRNRLHGQEFTYKSGEIPRAILISAIPVEKSGKLISFSTLEQNLRELGGDSFQKLENGALQITQNDGSIMTFKIKHEGRVSVFLTNAEGTQERLGTAWSDDAAKLAARFVRGRDLRISVKPPLEDQRFVIPENDYLK